MTVATEALARDWTDGGCRGPLDVSDSWILVPTRHAGRRLRAALARLANAKGSAVLTGNILTPEHLIPLPEQAAPDGLVLSVLTRLLMDSHPRFPVLFPRAEMPWDRFSFALGIATQLQDVRRQLCEADRTVAELIPRVPEEETDRWREIAIVEQELVRSLEKLGRPDPLRAKLDAARNGTDGVPCRHIHALFIPDISALAARMLLRLSAGCEVHLHVLAPDREADRFDEWGRPRAEAWESDPLPIPASSIHVYEQGGDELDALVQLVNEAENENRALALCTPDATTAQALARELDVSGPKLFLPNGIPLSATVPGRLLTDWLRLLRQSDYAATASFLRNPDAQDWLNAKDTVPAAQLLQELDACQNRHLPVTFEDLRRFSRSDSPALSRALETIAEAQTLPLADFLAALYDRRAPGTEMPAFFAESAQALSQLVLDTENTAEQAGLSAEERNDLLLALLPMQHVFPKPAAADVREALGWLEIQWETARAVVLSQMREGVIPETRVGDAFLPDSLRVAAGMAGNREALARDLFLTRTLLESRPTGAVRFLYSRRAANQDPQLPSRILMACPDDDLPDRVALLFEGTALHSDSGRRGPPTLILRPPACTPEMIPRHLSVTGFKAYLACPFRFYLSHVLKMAAADDGSREMDARVFGSLAHEMLEQLAAHPDLDDETELQNLLLSGLDRRFQERFGRRPSLVLTVQLESLRERLRGAARVQAGAVREGWRILSGESGYAAELDAMTIQGRLDRIERHPDGRIRILDYKTTDSGIDPLKAHYQPGNDAWIDLQLPLYRFMFAQRHPDEPVPEVGYFNLPKAVTETGIRLMAFTEGETDMYASALAAARQVIHDIQAGIFWPPARIPPDWDDFNILSPNTPEWIRKVDAR